VCPFLKFVIGTGCLTQARQALTKFEFNIDCYQKITGQSWPVNYPIFIREIGGLSLFDARSLRL
jgi:hypothetical protein